MDAAGPLQLLAARHVPSFLSTKVLKVSQQHPARLCRRRGRAGCGGRTPTGQTQRRWAGWRCGEREGEERGNTTVGQGEERGTLGGVGVAGRKTSQPGSGGRLAPAGGSSQRQQAAAARHETGGAAAVVHWHQHSTAWLYCTTVLPVPPPQEHHAACLGHEDHRFLPHLHHTREGSMV